MPDYGQSMINIALVNRQPRTMGIKELIQHFVEHRKEVITRRTKFLLKKAQQRGHILEGLIFAVCDIDEVIRLIRSSKTREEAIGKLRERAFRIAVDHPYAARVPKTLLDRAAAKPIILTQVQAEHIGRLQLIQLVGLEIEKLVEEYRAVVEEIEGYEAILRSESLVMDIIREDIFEMKEKYVGMSGVTQITGDVFLEFNRAGSDRRSEDVVVTVLTWRGRSSGCRRTRIRAQGAAQRRDQGAGIEGRGFRRAPVRREHTRLSAFLYESGARVREACLRCAGDVADERREIDRKSVELPDRRENAERAGDRRLRERRAFPDVRDEEGDREKDGAERV